MIGGAYAAAFQLNDQHRHYMLRANVNFRSKEQLVFQVSLCLAEQYEKDNTQISLEVLEEELGVEPVVLELVLQDLQEANICLISKDKEIILAKDSRRISLWNILDAVKGDSERDNMPNSELLEQYQEAIRDSSSNLSLFELVQKKRLVEEK